MYCFMSRISGRQFSSTLQEAKQKAIKEGGLSMMKAVQAGDHVLC
jgi:hypothetical protein